MSEEIQQEAGYIPKKKRGLFTAEEIKKRGKILSVEPSVLREDRFIIIFESGSQANANTETLKQLNINI